MPVPYRPNPFCSADTIKYGHWYQYPPEMVSLYGYLEARKVFRGIDAMTWFGLKYYLRHIEGEFFRECDMDEAQWFLDRMFDGKPTFHRSGIGSFGHMMDVFGGRVPLSIHAAPEGTVLPIGNVAMTVESTDSRFDWLVTWFESLLMKVWYPTMVATKGRALKEIIHAYLVKSGTPETVRRRLSDGSARSCTSIESQAIAGMAHLVNFDATTNIEGVRLAHNLYKCRVPRTALHGMEHSTIITWGKEREYEAYENMFEHNPSGGITIVGDSWDIYRVLKHAWGGKFKETILNRSGFFCARLDSGSPAGMVADAATILGDAFGTEKNAKGYKTLPSQVCLLQSEGVNLDSVPAIYEALTERQFSSDCLYLLSGNGVAQDVSRDNMSMAFKPSDIGLADGSHRAVRKEPVNEPGKWSKTGRLKLVVGENGHYRTEQLGESERPTHLQHMFLNGDTLVDAEMDDVWARSWTA